MGERSRVLWNRCYAMFFINHEPSVFTRRRHLFSGSLTVQSYKLFNIFIQLPISTIYITYDFFMDWFELGSGEWIGSIVVRVQINASVMFSTNNTHTECMILTAKLAALHPIDGQRGTPLTHWCEYQYLHFTYWNSDSQTINIFLTDFMSARLAQVSW